MSSKRELLRDLGHEDIVLLEPEYLDDAIIGVSHNDRAVYDYDKLVECFMKGEKFTEEEAIEWIDYNTLRALSYQNGAPIIVFNLDKYE